MRRTSAASLSPGFAMVDVLTLTNGSVYPRIAWNSVLDAADINTVSDAETDGAVEQVADWRSYTFWRPTPAGDAHVITCDLDGEQVVDAWAMAGNDADGLVGMDTWDGAAWVVFAEKIANGDGSVVYLKGAALSTTKLRFRFASVSFVSLLWAGVDMVLPEGLRDGWSDPLLALRAVLNPEMSRDGIHLGTSVEQWTANLTMNIKSVEATWARDYWTPFIRACSTRPFFLHWNPVDWPASACLCTKAKFGSAAFSANGFVDLDVSFDIDTGFDRRQTPISDSPALLTEGDTSGPLLLE